MYIVKQRNAYYFHLVSNSDEEATGFTRDIKKAYIFMNREYAIKTAKLFNATVIFYTTNEEINYK